MDRGARVEGDALAGWGPQTVSVTEQVGASCCLRHREAATGFPLRLHGEGVGRGRRKSLQLRPGLLARLRLGAGATGASSSSSMEGDGLGHLTLRGFQKLDEEWAWLKLQLVISFHSSERESSSLYIGEGYFTKTLKFIKL